MEHFHTIDSNEQILMSSSVVQPPWNLSTWIQLLLDVYLDIKLVLNVKLFSEHFLPKSGDKDAFWQKKLNICLNYLSQL